MEAASMSGRHPRLTDRLFRVSLFLKQVAHRGETFRFRTQKMAGRNYPKLPLVLTVPEGKPVLLSPGLSAAGRRRPQAPASLLLCTSPWCLGHLGSHHHRHLQVPQAPQVFPVVLDNIPDPQHPHWTQRWLGVPQSSWAAGFQFSLMKRDALGRVRVLPGRPGARLFD